MAISTLAPRERATLDRAREAIRELEPGAEVILYGSRARGEPSAESDFDLLILLEVPVEQVREAALLRRLYALELEREVLFGVVIHSREEWASPLFRAMPFHQNVSREGVRL